MLVSVLSSVLVAYSAFAPAGAIPHNDGGSRSLVKRNCTVSAAGRVPIVPDSKPAPDAQAPGLPPTAADSGNRPEVEQPVPGQSGSSAPAKKPCNKPPPQSQPPTVSSQPEDDRREKTAPQSQPAGDAQGAATLPQDSHIPSAGGAPRKPCNKPPPKPQPPVVSQEQAASPENASANRPVRKPCNRPPTNPQPSVVSQEEPGQTQTQVPGEDNDDGVEPVDAQPSENDDKSVEAAEQQPTVPAQGDDAQNNDDGEKPQNSGEDEKLAAKAGLSGDGAGEQISVTSHVQYSSSIGVLGCKGVDVSRIAFFPGSPGCDNFCVKVTYNGRSLNLLHIDNSAVSTTYDISCQAYDYLVKKEENKNACLTGDRTPMTYETVNPEECKHLLPGGVMPISAPHPNYYVSCVNTPTWKQGSLKMALFNIEDARCDYGIDEECSWSGVGDPTCPSGLGKGSQHELTGLKIKDPSYGG